MTRDAILNFVKDFDRLPDDAIVCHQATEVLLGGLVSSRQLRRKPPIPRRQISPQRFGFRAGDIRALIRGDFRLSRASRLVTIRVLESSVRLLSPLNGKPPRVGRAGAPLGKITFRLAPTI